LTSAATPHEGDPARANPAANDPASAAAEPPGHAHTPTQPKRPIPLGPHQWPRARRLAVGTMWAAAALLALVIARFLPTAIAAPALIAALGLGCYLIHRQDRRELSRRIERLADTVRTVGDIADPRYNAPTRRGPVAPTVPPTVESDPAADTPPNLDWLAAVTERRRVAVDRQLRWYMEARAALRAIIDGIDAPVFATDERGLIRLCNRQGDRLFRRRTGRLAGLELEELFTQSAILRLHAAAQNGVAGLEQVGIPIEGAPRIFEVSAVPVRMNIQHLPARTAPRAGVVLTLRDVTELARADQLKTDFVANASHELRTPIASIRAAVETFRGPAAADEAMRERLVRMIDTNIVRLEEMVSDLLDLSLRESPEQTPHPTRIDLRELADGFAAMFAAVNNERTLELRFDIEPGLVHLFTDPKLIRMILRNLIDNASKFAFEQTEITVSIRRTTTPDPHTDPDSAAESADDAEPGTDPTASDELPARDPEAVEPPRGPGLDGVEIAVRDRGVGIPLKDQERIFERFYQVDKSRARSSARRGTGLGLAIVKHATRVLGGEIRVDSVWQEGTTMTVTLPDAAVRIDPDGAPEPDRS